IALKVTGDALAITHHEPVYQSKRSEGETYQDFVDTKYITTKVSLKRLRLDSDGDGLTDLVEKALHTDPKKADTDGDGIDDKHDRMPNVNTKQWGPIER